MSYPTDKIRNVVLVGHSGSGKTTLAEALLVKAGAIERGGPLMGSPREKGGRGVAAHHGPFVERDVDEVSQAVLAE
jgi:translation elongation factor EF-G